MVLVVVFPCVNVHHKEPMNGQEGVLWGKGEGGSFGYHCRHDDDDDTTR